MDGLHERPSCSVKDARMNCQVAESFHLLRRVAAKPHLHERPSRSNSSHQHPSRSFEHESHKVAS